MNWEYVALSLVFLLAAGIMFLADKLWAIMVRLFVKKFRTEKEK